MNTFVFRGVDAELRWGYHVAATVKNWEMAPQDSSRFTVTAHVVSSDAYRVAQRPIVFTVQRKASVWRWTVESLQIAGETMTASLVLQE